MFRSRMHTPTPTRTMRASTETCSIERPRWQRTVVNAHVLKFRDIYVSLGDTGLAENAAPSLRPEPLLTTAEAAAAGVSPSQRSLLRLLSCLPITLFGDTPEQRLTYARLLRLVLGALEQPAQGTPSEAASKEEGAAATRIGTPAASLDVGSLQISRMETLRKAAVAATREMAAREATREMAAERSEGGQQEDGTPSLCQEALLPLSFQEMLDRSPAPEDGEALRRWCDLLERTMEKLW